MPSKLDTKQIIGSVHPSNSPLSPNPSIPWEKLAKQVQVITAPADIAAQRAEASLEVQELVAAGKIEDLINGTELWPHDTANIPFHLGVVREGVIFQAYAANASSFVRSGIAGKDGEIMMMHGYGNITSNDSDNLIDTMDSMGANTIGTLSPNTDLNSKVAAAASTLATDIQGPNQVDLLATRIENDTLMINKAGDGCNAFVFTLDGNLIDSTQNRRTPSLSSSNSAVDTHSIPLAEDTLVIYIKGDVSEADLKKAVKEAGGNLSLVMAKILDVNQNITGDNVTVVDQHPLNVTLYLHKPLQPIEALSQPEVLNTARAAVASTRAQLHDTLSPVRDRAEALDPLLYPSKRDLRGTASLMEKERELIANNTNAKDFEKSISGMHDDLLSASWAETKNRFSRTSGVLGKLWGAGNALLNLPIVASAAVQKGLDKFEDLGNSAREWIVRKAQDRDISLAIKAPAMAVTTTIGEIVAAATVFVPALTNAAVTVATTAYGIVSNVPNALERGLKYLTVKGRNKLLAEKSTVLDIEAMRTADPEFNAVWNAIGELNPHAQLHAADQLLQLNQEQRAATISLKANEHNNKPRPAPQRSEGMQRLIHGNGGWWKGLASIPGVEDFLFSKAPVVDEHGNLATDSQGNIRREVFFDPSVVRLVTDLVKNTDAFVGKLKQILIDQNAPVCVLTEAQKKDKLMAIFKQFSDESMTKTPKNDVERNKLVKARVEAQGARMAPTFDKVAALVEKNFPKERFESPEHEALFNAIEAVKQEHHQFVEKTTTLPDLSGPEALAATDAYNQALVALDTLVTGSTILSSMPELESELNNFSEHTKAESERSIKLAETRITFLSGATNARAAAHWNTIDTSADGPNLRKDITTLFSDAEKSFAKLERDYLDPNIPNTNILATKDSLIHAFAQNVEAIFDLRDPANALTAQRGWVYANIEQHYVNRWNEFVAAPFEEQVTATGILVDDSHQEIAKMMIHDPQDHANITTLVRDAGKNMEDAYRDCLTDLLAEGATEADRTNRAKQFTSELDATADAAVANFDSLAQNKHASATIITTFRQQILTLKGTLERDVVRIATLDRARLSTNNYDRTGLTAGVVAGFESTGVLGLARMTKDRLPMGLGKLLSHKAGLSAKFGVVGVAAASKLASSIGDARVHNGVRNIVLGTEADGSKTYEPLVESFAVKGILGKKLPMATMQPQDVEPWISAQLSNIRDSETLLRFARDLMATLAHPSDSTIETPAWKAQHKAMANSVGKIISRMVGAINVDRIGVKEDMFSTGVSRIAGDVVMEELLNHLDHLAAETDPDSAIDNVVLKELRNERLDQIPKFGQFLRGAISAVKGSAIAINQNKLRTAIEVAGLAAFMGPMMELDVAGLHKLISLNSGAVGWLMNRFGMNGAAAEAMMRVVLTTFEHVAEAPAKLVGSLGMDVLSGNVRMAGTFAAAEAIRHELHNDMATMHANRPNRQASLEASIITGARNPEPTSERPSTPPVRPVGPGQVVVNRTSPMDASVDASVDVPTDIHPQNPVGSDAGVPSAATRAPMDGGTAPTVTPRTPMDGGTPIPTTPIDGGVRDGGTTPDGSNNAPAPDPTPTTIGNPPRPAPTPAPTPTPAPAPAPSPAPEPAPTDPTAPRTPAEVPVDRLAARLSEVLSTTVATQMTASNENGGREGIEITNLAARTVDGHVVMSRAVAGRIANLMQNHDTNAALSGVQGHSRIGDTIAIHTEGDYFVITSTRATGPEGQRTVTSKAPITEILSRLRSSDRAELVQSLGLQPVVAATANPAQPGSPNPTTPGTAPTAAVAGSRTATRDHNTRHGGRSSHGHHGRHATGSTPTATNAAPATTTTTAETSASRTAASVASINERRSAAEDRITAEFGLRQRPVSDASRARFSEVYFENGLIANDVRTTVVRDANAALGANSALKVEAGPTDGTIRVSAGTNNDTVLRIRRNVDSQSYDVRPVANSGHGAFAGLLSNGGTLQDTMAVLSETVRRDSEIGVRAALVEKFGESRTTLTYQSVAPRSHAGFNALPATPADRSAPANATRIEPTPAARAISQAAADRSADLRTVREHLQAQLRPTASTATVRGTRQAAPERSASRTADQTRARTTSRTGTTTPPTAPATAARTAPTTDLNTLMERAPEGAQAARVLGATRSLSDSDRNDEPPTAGTASGGNGSPDRNGPETNSDNRTAGTAPRNARVAGTRTAATTRTADSSERASTAERQQESGERPTITNTASVSQMTRAAVEAYGQQEGIQNVLTLRTALDHANLININGTGEHATDRIALQVGPRTDGTLQVVRVRGGTGNFARDNAFVGQSLQEALATLSGRINPASTAQVRDADNRQYAAVIRRYRTESSRTDSQLRTLAQRESYRGTVDRTAIARAYTNTNVRSVIDNVREDLLGIELENSNDQVQILREFLGYGALHEQTVALEALANNPSRIDRNELPWAVRVNARAIERAVAELIDSNGAISAEAIANKLGISLSGEDGISNPGTQVVLRQLINIAQTASHLRLTPQLAARSGLEETILDEATTRSRTEIENPSTTFERGGNNRVTAVIHQLADISGDNTITIPNDVAGARESEVLLTTLTTPVTESGIRSRLDELRRAHNDAGFIRDLELLRQAGERYLTGPRGRVSGLTVPSGRTDAVRLSDTLANTLDARQALAIRVGIALGTESGRTPVSFVESLRHATPDVVAPDYRHVNTALTASERALLVGAHASEHARINDYPTAELARTRDTLATETERLVNSGNPVPEAALRERLGLVARMQAVLAQRELMNNNADRIANDIANRINTAARERHDDSMIVTADRIKQQLLAVGVGGVLQMRNGSELVGGGVGIGLSADLIQIRSDNGRHTFNVGLDLGVGASTAGVGAGPAAHVQYRYRISNGLDFTSGATAGADITGNASAGLWVGLQGRISDRWDLAGVLTGGVGLSYAGASIGAILGVRYNPEHAMERITTNLREQMGMPNSSTLPSIDIQRQAIARFGLRSNERITSLSDADVTRRYRAMEEGIRIRAVSGSVRNGLTGVGLAAMIVNGVPYVGPVFSLTIGAGIRLEFHQAENGDILHTVHDAYAEAVREARGHTTRTAAGTATTYNYRVTRELTAPQVGTDSQGNARAVEGTGRYRETVIGGAADSTDRTRGVNSILHSAGVSLEGNRLGILHARDNVQYRFLNHNVPGLAINAADTGSSATLTLPSSNDFNVVRVHVRGLQHTAGGQDEIETLIFCRPGMSDQEMESMIAEATLRPASYVTANYLSNASAPRFGTGSFDAQTTPRATTVATTGPATAQTPTGTPERALTNEEMGDTVVARQVDAATATLESQVYSTIVGNNALMARFREAAETRDRSAADINRARIEVVQAVVSTHPADFHNARFPENYNWDKLVGDLVAAANITDISSHPLTRQRSDVAARLAAATNRASSIHNAPVRGEFARGLYRSRDRLNARIASIRTRLGEEAIRGLPAITDATVRPLGFELLPEGSRGFIAVASQRGGWDNRQFNGRLVLALAEHFDLQSHTRDGQAVDRNGPDYAFARTVFSETYDVAAVRAQALPLFRSLLSANDRTIWDRGRTDPLVRGTPRYQALTTDLNNLTNAIRTNAMSGADHFTVNHNGAPVGTIHLHATVTHGIFNSDANLATSPNRGHCGNEVYSSHLELRLESVGTSTTPGVNVLNVGIDSPMTASARYNPGVSLNFGMVATNRNESRIVPPDHSTGGGRDPDHAVGGGRTGNPNANPNPNGQDPRRNPETGTGGTGPREVPSQQGMNPRANPETGSGGTGRRQVPNQQGTSSSS